MRLRFVAIMGCALLAGCGGRGAMPDAPRTDATGDWRTIATDADRARLRGWRTTWLDAVGRARAAGFGRQITAAGPLFNPDILLPDAVPPPGDYQCRVFKLGAKHVGSRDFLAGPQHRCRVANEGDVASFHKIAGSQRPIGLIFPDQAGRGVFLGTLTLGDETRPLDYGRDATRDMAGFVDRIGERRWRIVLPLPAFESTLDVIELTPAG